MISINSKSKSDTQKVAAFLAEEILKTRPGRATVVALVGELGSGKTTFVQGFAKTLGIKENVLSPTFVLMKFYHAMRKSKARHLIHVDCYRVNYPREILHLGWRRLLRDPDAILVVEWADRIKKIIPRDAIWLRFQHSSQPQERIIEIL